MATALIISTSPPPAVVFPTLRAEPVKIVQSIKQVDTKPLEKLELLPLPVAAPYSYQNTYDWGNCTWYVAGRKKVPESWGNANTWAARAAAQGITISNAPMLGAIAQSSSGYWGHVAVVTNITGDMVEVSEMNVVGLGQIDSTWYPISRFDYIYI